MRSDDIQAQRSCGYFFLLLVALSLVLACANLYSGQWGTALRFVPGMVVFGGIAYFALHGTATKEAPEPEQGAGTSEAGKPVPVGPKPQHHLVGAKELPPSDKTHSFPKD
jgi:hypothetical protein